MTVSLETGRRLNVGIVGSGFMGKAHSLAYAAMPMYFWPAPAVPYRKVIAEVTNELAETAASRFGYESWTTDWRRIVDDPDIDVVDISSPNDTHCEIAVAAAEAGKHIICEKPIARTAEEARQMVEAANRAGIINMVAFNYRRTPAVALAKKYIDEGAIGRVLSFHGTYYQDWSADRRTPLAWRFKKSAAGSGALGDIGSHSLDLARHLVGEIASVTAILQTHITERPLEVASGESSASEAWVTESSTGTVDVDDEVNAIFRFASGAVGSLGATRNAHGRPNFDTFEIHGESGSLYFDYQRCNELQVCFTDDEPDRQGFRTIITGPAHPYGDALWPVAGVGIGYAETKIIECYELCRAIVEGIAAQPDFGDGYQVARICEAIQASASSGTWIDIPPLDRQAFPFASDSQEVATA
jgi:predicted dehydrogenase